jgi:hypothetical protein
MLILKMPSSTSWASEAHTTNRTPVRLVRAITEAFMASDLRKEAMTLSALENRPPSLLEGDTATTVEIVVIVHYYWTAADLN